MIQAMVRMDMFPEKLNEALQILHSTLERTRAKSGCVGCSVFEDTEQVNRIVLCEKWENEEDLLGHLRSEDYKRVLLVMEMSRTPPEISFDTIADTGGVEVIVRARTGKEK